MNRAHSVLILLYARRYCKNCSSVICTGLPSIFAIKYNLARSHEKKKFIRARRQKSLPAAQNLSQKSAELLVLLLEESVFSSQVMVSAFQVPGPVGQLTLNLVKLGLGLSSAGIESEHLLGGQDGVGHGVTMREKHGDTRARRGFKYIVYSWLSALPGHSGKAD
jgi:hypothetical protein